VAYNESYNTTIGLGKIEISQLHLK